MSKPYTPENLPDEYPLDQQLILEAETTPGIHAHDRNKKIAIYRLQVANFARQRDARRWFSCVDAERSLRGIVAEAKTDRFKLLFPYHESPV